MVVLKKNSCRICFKVFCCSDCRDLHETNKHPKPKCPLCVNEHLIYNPNLNTEFNTNSGNVSHVIFNHLPLRCKLCGDKFTNSQDLTQAPPCRWWRKQKERKEKEKAAQLSIDDSIPCIVGGKIIKLQNDVEKKLPQTPQFHANISVSKSLCSIKTGSISLLKQENFDSPPELVRHTSTPMHSIGVTGQKQTSSTSVPQLNYKTPSCTFESTSSDSACTASSSIESRYYTGLTTLGSLGRFSISPANDNHDSASDNKAKINQSWNSPSCPILKKPLKPISSEISSNDSNNKRADERIEKSIIKSDVLERISCINDSRSESIEKRVRFSDQCLAPNSPDVSSAQEMAADSSIDNEIFFEARESLEDNNENCDRKQISNSDRIVVEQQTRNDIVESMSCQCCLRNGKSTLVNEKESLPSSTFGCNNNNNDKISSVVADSSVGENKSTASVSSSSSRVLMMLLVENSDSKGLSSLDLAPLIDTGLKKLEESIAGNNLSNIDKGSHEKSNASSVKLSTEVSGFACKVNSSISESSGSKGQACGNFRTIEDSFVGISDRIECFSTSASASKQSQEVDEEQQHLQQANKAECSVVSSCKSDGIFSVVARVVRCALKKLPAVGSVTSRNLSREPIPQSSSSASLRSVASTEVLTVGTVGAVTAATATSSHVMLQRSANKRPRDRSDSIEEQAQAPSRDSPGGSSSGSSRSEVVSSPAAKRHRGWYRIRAREPIARMRERQVVVSPRGASREIQRFQQGSLIIGDQLVPLPSRAHQATQTND